MKLAKQLYDRTNIGSVKAKIDQRIEFADRTGKVGDYVWIVTGGAQPSWMAVCFTHKDDPDHGGVMMFGHHTRPTVSTSEIRAAVREAWDELVAEGKIAEA